MKKNNKINRILFRNSIKKNQELMQEITRKINMCDDYIGTLKGTAIENNASTLCKLFDLHKEIWNNGIRNKNIGPDRYGIFRTEDISTMKYSEVYLGNIFGLWTLPIPEWVDKTERYCYSSSVAQLSELEIVTKQYKDLLLSNIKDIKSNLMLEQYKMKKLGY